MGLHGGQAKWYMRPGLRTPQGSKVRFTRSVSLASGSGSGSKTNTEARKACGPRISVAWPVAGGIAPRTTWVEPCSESGTETHSRPPDQS